MLGRGPAFFSQVAKLKIIDDNGCGERVPNITDDRGERDPQARAMGALGSPVRVEKRLRRSRFLGVALTILTFCVELLRPLGDTARSFLFLLVRLVFSICA